MRPDIFPRHVRDALANLYDPIHLQTHPLAGLLDLQRLPGQTTGELLRETLRQAIISLRPPESVPLERPEWLSYRILWLRYAQSLTQEEVCAELGLSQTTYYRRHQGALEAVTAVLRERHAQQGGDHGSAQPAPDRAGGDQVGARARRHAAALACNAPRESVSLDAVLHGALQTVYPLAQRRGIRITAHSPEQLPTTYADPAVLRQLLCAILSEGLRRCAGEALQLRVVRGDSETRWYLAGWGSLRSADLDVLPGLGVGQALLGAYGGKMWVEHDSKHGFVLGFNLPLSHPATILIIEDDADTMDLYRRYFQTSNYAIRTAPHAEELDAVLTEEPPDLILLDVLMPKRDGWAILQHLKGRPDTASIPVVVCSVLPEPELALALGAVAVLCKPVTEQQLLATVKTILND